MTSRATSASANTNLALVNLEFSVVLTTARFVAQKRELVGNVVHISEKTSVSRNHPRKRLDRNKDDGRRPVGLWGAFAGGG